MAKTQMYKSSSGSWIVRKVIKTTPTSEVATKRTFSSKKKATEYSKSNK